MSGILEGLAGRLGLPEELLPGPARLTLIGGSQVRVENHRCLLSFAPEAVEIGCGKQRLRIRGSGLELRGMERGELFITGTVFSVEVDGA